MAYYFEEDIGTSFEGDIEITPNGDIKLANPVETRSAVANFLLRTDNGGYAPDLLLGCNLGSFVGRLSNSENLQEMESNILRSLAEKVYSLADIDAVVVPFDINEVLCVVTLAGTYELSGAPQTINGERLAYTFPYIDGTHITPIVIE